MMETAPQDLGSAVSISLVYRKVSKYLKERDSPSIKWNLTPKDIYPNPKNLNCCQEPLNLIYEVYAKICLTLHSF